MRSDAGASSFLGSPAPPTGVGRVSVSRESLSRLVSYALRHEPWVYELELDDEGWVGVDDLLTAIREKGADWATVDRGQLAGMIESSPKRRFEFDGERVRALYGHSLPGRIAKLPAAPPEVLFHGTSPSAWVQIRRAGLRPMGRQYVHLSVDIATATAVGRRKSPRPIVLRIDAAAASSAGVVFYLGNEMVWLASRVPAEFIAPLKDTLFD